MGKGIINMELVPPMHRLLLCKVKRRLSKEQGTKAERVHEKHDFENKDLVK